MTPDELRTWMTEHDYNVAQLAAALEVQRKTVYRWLAGEAPISHVTALAIRGLGATSRSESPAAPKTQS